MVTSGGKRLRAAFCYWAWIGSGGPEMGAADDSFADPEELIINVGAAFEFGRIQPGYALAFGQAVHGVDGSLREHGGEPAREGCGKGGAGVRDHPHALQVGAVQLCQIF